MRLWGGRMSKDFILVRGEARARRALRQSRIDCASNLRARCFFRPIGAHGFTWKITGGHSGVRVLDNFQRFIE